jgi:hypothetical protein
MSLENDIRSILFEIGKDIKIYTLQDGHMVIDIDYEKYLQQILNLIDQDNS